MEDLESDLEKKLSCIIQASSQHSSDEAQRLLVTSRQTLDQAELLSEKVDMLVMSTAERKHDQRSELAAQLSTLEDLVAQLQEFKSIVESVPRENRILSRLQFQSMHSREDSIVSPISVTFGWVLDALKSSAVTSSDTGSESSEDAGATVPRWQTRNISHTWQGGLRQIDSHENSWPVIQRSPGNWSPGAMVANW
jgi:hypothetical protein